MRDRLRRGGYMSEIESRNLPSQPTLVMRTETTVAGIPEFLGRAYGASAAHAQVAGVDIVGPPFARYERLNGPESGFAIEAGFPVSKAVDGSGDVEASALPGGPAAAIWHIGPYDTMQPTYAAAMAWIEDQGATPSGTPWEIYYSDPSTQPDPATWRTEVIWPYLPGG
jgi:effector-binding domain-containing protein